MWQRTESGRVLIMSGDERERELLSALSILSLSSSISLLCPQFASDIATSNTNARSTMKKKEATATKAVKQRFGLHPTAKAPGEKNRLKLNFSTSDSHSLSLSLSQPDLQKSDPLGFWVLSKILIWVLRKKMGFPSKKEKEEGRTARKRRGHCRRYWNSTFTRSYIHLFIYFTIVVPSRLYQSFFFFTNLDA